MDIRTLHALSPPSLAFKGGFRGSKQPIELLSSTGKAASEREITQFLGELARQDTKEGNLPVIAAIGPGGRRKRAFLNQLCGSDLDASKFLPTAPSASLSGAPEIGNTAVVLDVSTLASLPADTDEEDKLTTGQMMALACPLWGVCVLPVWQSEVVDGGGLPSSVSSLLLKVVREEVRGRRGAGGGGRSEGRKAGPLKIIFAVQGGDGTLSSSDATKAFTKGMSDLFSALEKPPGLQGGMAGLVDVTAVVLPSSKYRPQEYQKALVELRQVVKGAADKAKSSRGVRGSQLPGTVGGMWAAVRERLDVSTDSPSVAVLAASAHATSTADLLMDAAKVTLSQWKRRVDRGTVTDDFGHRAHTLITSTLDQYDRNTQMDGLSSMRQRRRDEIRSTLEADVRDLFNRQLALLQRRSLKDLREKLVAALTPQGSVEANQEAAALRQVEFTFDESSSDLLVSCMADELKPAIDEAKKTLMDRLRAYAGKFPESNEAKVQARLRMEERMRPQQQQQRAGGKKAKRERAFGMRLALASMVRQDGNGNLQGFASYDAGPFSMIMGYANDRDTPEAMQNGEKPPFLRLQPKIHLDIDL